MFRFSRSVFAAALLLTTAFRARADFSFVHTSDTHVGAGDNVALDAAQFREIRALEPRPAFLVNTGDVTESGLESEFVAYKKVRDENLGMAIPVYDAPGNHDARWNPLGKEGYTRGLGAPLYRSWDKENVHFVVLDSTVLLQHWGHFDREQLDWLAKDLRKNGRDRPVVIGFHHFFLRDAKGGGSQVDNHAALLETIAPYNVRLFLIGHGHSDIAWSINGIPAIMTKGLYQGSYNRISVNKNALQIVRRTATGTHAPFTVSLARPAAERSGWRTRVSLDGDTGTVTVMPGTLPRETAFAFGAGGNLTPLTRQPSGDHAATFRTNDWLPGAYTALVSATLPNPSGDPIAPVYVEAVPLNVPVKTGNPAPIWTRTLPSAIQTRLVRAGDLLYVPTMNGSLYALDAATGKTRWQFDTGGALFSVPCVADGVVYIGSADHFVYALNAATGKPKWKRETGGSVLAGAARAGNVVCIASTDRKIYGLSAATGAVIWTQAVESLYQSAALTDGKRFYLGGWDNRFRALDASTGTPVWTKTFGKSFYFSPAIGSPTFGGGSVFVTSNDGLLHATNVATGEIAWETPSLRLGYSAPLFQTGTIYNASLSDTGIVYAFDAATGDIKWQTPTGAIIYDSSCAATNGTVFVGSVNGVFSALRQSDGVLLWQYRLGAGHLLASPVADNARVFIANMDGTVVAFPTP